MWGQVGYYSRVPTLSTFKPCTNKAIQFKDKSIHLKTSKKICGLYFCELRKGKATKFIHLETLHHVVDAYINMYNACCTLSHTIALLQCSLEQLSRDIKWDGWSCSYGNCLPIGRHEAIDTKLLHDLLLKELHLLRFSMHQHHIAGLTLREGGREEGRGKN